MAAKPWTIIFSERKGSFLLFLATLALIALVTAVTPPEQSLGGNLRLILLHGAWVWAGLLAFGASAAAGLAGLLTRGSAWHAWSRALGLTGLGFWLTYLPMSLLVMQVGWGGLFFDEPRWRIPFTFAVVGVLLQAGLFLLDNPRLAAVGNLLFGAALLARLMTADTVLHPESPVAQSGSLAIQLSFTVLLALALGLGLQVAWRLRSQFLH